MFSYWQAVQQQPGVQSVMSPLIAAILAKKQEEEEKKRLQGVGLANGQQQSMSGPAAPSLGDSSGFEGSI